MKARKGLALFLSIAMILSMLSLTAFAAEGEPAVSFPDAADSWAKSSIERWAGYGIVKGDEKGNVNPAADLTRGELAQMFVNLFGLSEKAENTYADLEGGEWYADAILKCTAAGILQGDGANCNGNAHITRAEVMVMFGRAMGVAPAAEPDLSKFTDGAEVPDWAAGYMAPLVEMGVVSGVSDGVIAATINIDRASTLALLDKAIVEYVNAPGEVALDASKGFVVVNVSDKEAGAVLTGSAANVVVAAGAADGKVVLKDLTAGTVTVAGAADLSVEGKSDVSALSVDAAGSVAIAKDAKVGSVAVNAEAELENAGTVTTLTANAAAEITNTGKVTDMVLEEAAKVTNDGTVTNLTANAPAEIVNTGKVTTLTANAAAEVDNKGTVSKAEIKADGVVLDGKKPTSVSVDKGVKNPTNSDGKEVKPGSSGSSGGGGSSHSHSWTLTTAATCTTDGVESCSCGQTRVIKALGHKFDAEGKCENDASHLAGDVWKFYLAVAGAGEDPTKVDATVYDDYSAVVTVPDAKVDASAVTVSAKMQNVDSLGVSSVREHEVTVSTGLKSQPDLGEWLDNAFTFESGTVTGTIDGKPYTYNLTGKEGAEGSAVLTATAEDIQETREAWHALTAHVTSETHEDNSYIEIANGSYLQIGTDKMEFEESYEGNLVLDNFNDMSAIKNEIKKAVKLNTEADQDALGGYQIVGVLKKGTALAVGSSIATLDADATIGISGLTAENYADILDELRSGLNTDGIYNLARTVVTTVNNIIGDVNGKTVTIDISFDVPEPEPETPEVPETPGTGTETPEVPETPGTGTETPEVPETPGTGTETPEVPETPGTGTETPDPETPGTGTEDPDPVVPAVDPVPAE